MTCTVAYAGPENPAQNSYQSGIGIVSGFHCDANRIEVSFNGGGLINVPYGSTRNDTINICGDDDNGYGLLWNYNLLGPGKHSVDTYADGALIGSSTFTVTTLGAEFLPGLQSGRRVYGFPDLDHDVILNWQQGNQNYIISDYTTSINSYDVAGIWETYFNGQVDGELSIHVSPSKDDPEFAELVALWVNDAFQGGFMAGAMQRNRAGLTTNPDLGASVTMDVELLFTGPREGYIELISCSPSFECQQLGINTGDVQTLVKAYPFVENAVLPHAAIADDSKGARKLSDDSNEVRKLSDDFYDAYMKSVEELEYLIEEMDEPPLKEIYQD